ncbi:hypothetical protein BQ8482_330018 [Mesorhizobium delmotii]|uniref:Uncharacterized protein n=1 Tax=Mesorhizobium delmotii TaxID=1631247 RepID=A0A2P9ANZ9_9HYPH|nr:hypothetical protein BQ8482_330018 [Mesorhizobium delmotii]
MIGFLVAEYIARGRAKNAVALRICGWSISATLLAGHPGMINSPQAEKPGATANDRSSAILRQ